MSRQRLYDQKPEPRRCNMCDRKSEDRSGFCSLACKEAAQIRTWKVPLLDLPIRKRVPRLVPEVRR